jgi:glutamate-1-semialdehyde 2,1-aminomutase
VNSPVRAWRGVGGRPLFIARGSGARVWDADDNEFIDYLGSWGPLILGHAPPRVVAAIQSAAARGTSYGAPSELEIELARRIQGAFPAVGMIRFVNSGTEATMSAIRLARAFTRRDLIVKFDGGYHGHADMLLARGGSGLATLGLPDSAGVPAPVAAQTLVVPYNDLDGLRRVLNVHGKAIAAIIVEPVAGNMGVVPPAPGFLEGLRTLTHEFGALLIFDEVITGFRVAWGGAQALFGVMPDLSCFGKIIGGGLPVGAFGGRREIMQLLAPEGPVYQAGTLSGNPLAMAAGIATLDALQARSDSYVRLESLTGRLEAGVRGAANAVEIPIRINRVGSMLTIFFAEGPVTDYASARTADTARYARFFHRMLKAGIYLPPSQFEASFVSLAHTEGDIAETVERAAQALGELGQ